MIITYLLQQQTSVSFIFLKMNCACHKKRESLLTFYVHVIFQILIKQCETGKNVKLRYLTISINLYFLRHYVTLWRFNVLFTRLYKSITSDIDIDQWLKSRDCGPQIKSLNLQVHFVHI